jgi:hypothetical protein
MPICRVTQANDNGARNLLDGDDRQQPATYRLPPEQELENEAQDCRPAEEKNWRGSNTGNGDGLGHIQEQREG